MSAILAGVTGPVWGTVDEAAFWVDNIQEEFGAEENILTDGDGEQVMVAYHGKTGDFSMDFAVKTSATAPLHTLVGHTLTVADPEFGGTYFVRGVTRTRRQGDWLKGRLSARRFFASTFTTTTTTATTTA